MNEPLYPPRWVKAGDEPTRTFHAFESWADALFDLGITVPGPEGQVDGGTISWGEQQCGSCTCCATPRPMHRDTPKDEWQHDDDATYAEVFHVHEDTSGRDCDGQLDHSRTYTIPMLRWRDGELSYKTMPEPDRHDLWVKLARTAAPLHSPCEVTVVDNDDTTLTLNWHRLTDEGSEGGQLRGCVDPTCTDEPDRQRDHYAEAMGY